MNYELAKKLKDAGFHPKGFYEFICPHGMTSNISDIKGECKYTMVPLPTLEELIEACGEYFLALRFAQPYEESKLDKLWIAGSTHEGRHVETGSTPSEAVANLWLALNEKK